MSPGHVWTSDEARRAFKALPRRQSENTPSAVVQLERRDVRERSKQRARCSPARQETRAGSKQVMSGT
ncbi:MAG: hypothetical protein JNJ54_09515 [Myxococcaceae bacterium]|nr:hypothetical protein [Myxococcaceae bacterium]